MDTVLSWIWSVVLKVGPIGAILIVALLFFGLRGLRAAESPKGSLKGLRPGWFLLLVATLVGGHPQVSQWLNPLWQKIFLAEHRVLQPWQQGNPATPATPPTAGPQTPPAGGAPPQTQAAPATPALPPASTIGLTFSVDRRRLAFGALPPDNGWQIRVDGATESGVDASTNMYEHPTPMGRVEVRIIGLRGAPVTAWTLVP